MTKVKIVNTLYSYENHQKIMKLLKSLKCIYIYIEIKYCPCLFYIDKHGIRKLQKKKKNALYGKAVFVAYTL
jgi:hypothetical protein